MNWNLHHRIHIIESFCFQEMDNIPKPQTLTLDPNDENIILEMPDDRDPLDEQSESTDAQKKKASHTIIHSFVCLLTLSQLIARVSSDLFAC